MESLSAELLLRVTDSFYIGRSIHPRLAAVAVPIFAEGGRLGAEVVGDDGGQMDAVGARPLLGEEDVVVLRGAERPGIILLRAGVPELEKTDGHVAAQGVDVARADGMLMHAG